MRNVYGLKILSVLLIASVGAAGCKPALIADKRKYAVKNMNSTGPQVTDLTPDPVDRKIDAGEKIGLQGTGFVEGMIIKINGTNCIDVQLFSDTQAACTAEADIPRGEAVIEITVSEATPTPSPSASASASPTPTSTSSTGSSGSSSGTTTTVVANTAPTISNIANQAASPMGTAITGIAFTMDEGSTATEDAQTVTVSFSSSNTSLIPASAISVSGGTDTAVLDAATLTPTISITPTANRIGTATITATVTDTGTGALTATDTFTVTIEPIKSSNLKLWLKADAGTYVESAAPTTAVTAASGAPELAAGFTRTSNQSLYMNDSAATSTGNIDFSISTWFIMQTAAADMTIMSRYTNSNATMREFRLIWKSADQKLYFQVFNAAGAMVGEAASSSTIAAGTWVFAYGYHDATNDQVGLSLNNGTIVTGATTGNPSDTNAGLALSCDISGSTDCFDGIIGASGFWKKVLSAAEVTELYNSGTGIKYSGLSAGIKTSMVGYWNLDETTAASARNDSNTGANHLTAWNNPSVAAGIKKAVRYWADQSGTGNHFTQSDLRKAPALILSGSNSAMRFNGINFSMTAPDTATLEPTTAMTVFWVSKLNTASGSYEFLLSKTNGGWTSGWALGDVCNGAGNMWQGFWITDYGKGACSTATTLTSYVVAARWDGARTTTWYNGEPKANYGHATAPTYGAEVITLGAEPGLAAANHFKGEASEFLIYNTALTNEEVLRTSAYLGYKYSIDITPSTGRRLWLKADAITGLVAGDDVASWTDSSALTNHATAGAGSRPTYQTDAMAGSPAVRYSGNKCMITGAGDALSDFSSFVAYKNNGTAATYERLLDKNIATGFWMGRQSNTASSWGAGALESATPWGVYGSLTDGSVNLLSSFRQGTHLTSARNGSSLSTRVLASTAATDTSAYGIGCEYTGADASVKFNGDIGEVMVYNSNLSENDRARVGQQLATKYGANVSVAAPYQISGLTVWLRGDSGVTKDGSNKISAWDDASGNGTNFVQATGASQPTWVSDGGASFNNLPVVRFSNAQEMRPPAAVYGSAYFVSSPAYTVYMLFKASTISTNSATAYGNDTIWGDFNGGMGTFLRSAGLVVSYNWDGTVDSSSGVIAAGSVHLVRQRLASGTLYLKVGDAAETSAVTTWGAGYSTGNVIGIGNSYGGQYFDGDLAEILFFNKDLSVAEQASTCGYLSTRYNLGLACN